MAQIVRSQTYTVRETAQLLSVHAEYVRQLIRAGDLDAHMATRGKGGGYRVSHDELERFVRDRWSPFLRLAVPETEQEN